MHLLEQLEEQIEFGDRLLSNTRSNLSHIYGAQKFENKINSELKFLRPLRDKIEKLKPQHLVSSNLKSLDSIYQLAIKEKDLERIFYNAKLENGEKIQIDLVAEGKWIKSCSRKSKALIQKWFDGEDVIVPLAKKMLDASLLIHEFLPPEIHFYFHAGVPKKLSTILERLGIMVHGELQDFPEFDIDDESDSDDSDYEKYSNKKSSNIVNLDTCTMITLVSNLSNGYANFKFHQSNSKFMMHLDDMAIDERKKRVLPDIVKFIRSKQWIASQSAAEEFDRIISLIAGDAEKARAERLKTRLEIVENDTSERIDSLPDSARISVRAKLSFGTGESNKAVTVSSNTGFIRAARQQGVYVSVFEHRPRALSENKEKFATILTDELDDDFKIDYFSQLFDCSSDN